MAGEPIVTIVGNLTRDPQFTTTKDGTPVCSFTVAQTPRTKVGDEWKDAEPTFYRCTVWRDHAQNAYDTLLKGMRVVAHGRLRTRTYTDKDGNERLSVDLEVDEVGPALRYASATVTKVRKGEGRARPFDGDRLSEVFPQDDPWPTDAAPVSVGAAATTAADDDTPF